MNETLKTGLLIGGGAVLAFLVIAGGSAAGTALALNARDKKMERDDSYVNFTVDPEGDLADMVADEEIDNV